MQFPFASAVLDAPKSCALSRLDATGERIGPTPVSEGLASMPPDDLPATSAVRRYLAVLAEDAPPSAFIEIRYRAREQSFVPEFFSIGDLDSAAASIIGRGRSTDVYVGCVPRSRRAGTKDAIVESQLLWAECDGADAVRAAMRWNPPPAMVVASGSGPNIHAYWPLARTLSPRDAETANLRLARAIGADAACFDVGRILRPPATWNHKQRPPRPVALLRLEPRRFEPEDVLAAAPELKHDAIDRRWDPRPSRRAVDDPLMRVPPAVYVEALLGRRPGRDRKVVCPFHDDACPSLHVYASAERGWTCFSCRRGGSIYDLAAELWGMRTRGRDFVQLRKRLGLIFDGRETVTRARER